MTGHRFFVYGSCVSRDTFELLAAHGHTLSRYVARQSLASAGVAATGSLTGIDRLPSAFQRRMLSGDVAGDLVTHLTRLEPDPARVLLWDLTDERLGLHVWPDGSVTTDSVEARTAGLDPTSSSYRHVPFGSDEHFARWSAGLDRFEQALADSAVDRVLLLDVPWAEITTSGVPVPPSFGTTPAEANELFRRYVGHAASRPWVRVIRIEDVRADDSHRWGPAPFHYDAATYEGLVNRVTAHLGRAARRPVSSRWADEISVRARRQSFGRELDARPSDASVARAILDGRLVLAGSDPVDPWMVLDGHCALPASDAWRAAWHGLDWADPLRRFGALGYARSDRLHERVISCWLGSAPDERDDIAWSPRVVASRTLALVAAVGQHGARPRILDALERHSSILALSASPRAYARVRELAGVIAVAATLGDSDRLRAVAERMLPALLDAAVSRDGGPTSGSSGSHAALFAGAAEVVARLEIAATPIDDRTAAVLESMAEHVAHSTQPDGLLAPLGDTGARRPDAVAHPAVEYARSGGSRGRPPGRTLADYPVSGHVFWRTSWRQDAAFVAVRTHDAPRPDSSTHADAGSVTLTIGSTTYLRDLGRPVPGGPPPSVYRSADAHNVVLVEGERFGDPPVATSAPSDPWVHLERRGARGTIWHRSVHLSQRGVLLVSDELSGAEGEWRQRWHLPAGTELTQAPTGTTATIDVPGAEPLHVAWSGPAGTALRAAEGPGGDGAPVLELIVPSGGALLTAFGRHEPPVLVLDQAGRPAGVADAAATHPTVEIPRRLNAAVRAEPGRREDLGPLRATCVRAAAVTWTGAGPRALLIGDGRPASLTEVDCRTGAVLRAASDDRHRTRAAVLPLDDDTWVGSIRSPDDATVWRLDGDGFREVMTDVADEKMIRCLARDVDGAVLAGTFPHGLLLRINDDGSVEQVGPVDGRSSYAWAIAADASGWWAGYGPGARLVHVDRLTRACTEVVLPVSIATPGSFVVTITVHPRGVLCFIGVDPSGTLQGVVVDRRTGGVSEFAGGLDLRLPGEFDPGAAALLALHDDALCLVSQAGAQTVAGGPAAEICAATTAMRAAPDGGSAAGVTLDGSVWWWDGRTTRVHPRVAPAGDLGVNALGTGPDGLLVVGAFLGPGVVGVARGGDDRVRVVPGPRQVDAAIAGGDGVLIASYPGLHLETASADLSSRRTLTRVGRDTGLADRPTALVATADLIAVGAVAPYGHPGGSLVVLDPGGASVSVVSPVPGHSVTALVPARGGLVGGTSVHGGRGSLAAAGSAAVFRFEPARGVVWSKSVPRPSRAVLGLASLEPSGHLMVLTDEGELVLLGSAGDVLASRRVGRGRESLWGLGAGLFRRPDDRAVYGYAEGRLFAADQDLSTVRVLVAHGVRHAVATDDGNVYLSDGRRITRLRPPFTS